MKVTREKIENSQAYLTIEMEAPEVEESLTGAYKRLVARASIPGFRKGKAPRTVVESTLGKEAMMDEALRQLVPDGYQKALEQEKLEALTQPELEVISTEPVKFKAIIPLKPTIVLGDYKAIKVESKTVKITEEQISNVVENLRHQIATWEPADRPSQFKDVVIFDVLGTSDDKKLVDQKGASYSVIEGSKAPVPGFAEQLVGMKKEEEKEFTLKLPDDYAQPEFAGKDAKFKVKVSEIKEEKLPEVNDDFARQINPEVAGIDELRVKINEELKATFEKNARTEIEDEAVKQLADQAKIEYPEVMVDMEVHRIMENQERRLAQYRMTMDDYLKNTGKTHEDLHKEMEPQAVKQIRESLALGKLSEDEKIEVSEEEVNAEIETMVSTSSAKDKDDLRKALNSDENRESVNRMVLSRKTLARLIEIAGGSVKVE